MTLDELVNNGVVVRVGLVGHHPASRHNLDAAVLYESVSRSWANELVKWREGICFLTGGDLFLNERAYLRNLSRVASDWSCHHRER
jgi:hypothetical protein